MKKIKIIWNKPTAHSRFWSLILFLGILPSAAFYTGIRVQALKREQEIIQKSSYQILFQSERGICRVSDCTIQGGGAVKASSTTSMPVINIISPRQGERLTQKSDEVFHVTLTEDF